MIYDAKATAERVAGLIDQVAACDEMPGRDDVIALVSRWMDDHGELAIPLAAGYLTWALANPGKAGKPKVRVP